MTRVVLRGRESGDIINTLYLPLEPVEMKLT